MQATLVAQFVGYLGLIVHTEIVADKLNSNDNMIG